MHVVEAALAGFVFGCACPGIVRKVRAYFFKEVSAVKAGASKDVAAAVKKL